MVQWIWAVDAGAQEVSIADASTNETTKTYENATVILENGFRKIIRANDKAVTLAEFPVESVGILNLVD
jgi:hypothetical protein